ncbi:hypothetical protein UFOVP1309_83 [uncultured Caudovirales phage]|uniref:Uncharacterized protein n=1 Tax=uncultured Caudovirales phage TaxID=2100421 RepID=A0A6J5RMY4_9CAUD|nr:hypothetical protein UFOVP1309_83 [uncultured Caudovirales phage]
MTIETHPAPYYSSKVFTQFDMDESLEADQDPVAHIATDALNKMQPSMLALHGVTLLGYNGLGTTAVYTAPPKRQPLTDAEDFIKALAELAEENDVLAAKNNARWRFLHSVNKDAEGFEWCVLRVKWENGRVSEAWQTNQDLSDLDSAIEAAHKIT